MENDPINHPSHYADGNIETIDFIEDRGYGFHYGNAAKYISRAGKKDPEKLVEDLEKAAWYLRRVNSIDYSPIDIFAARQIPLADYAEDKHLSFNLKCALACMDDQNPQAAAMYIQREINLIQMQKEENNA